MVLELKHVQKQYQDFRLDCSLKLREGYVTGLIGANGAGKSTTFKAILDLIHLDGGEICIFGKDHRELTVSEKEDIGVVLAESFFSGWLTVSQISGIMESLYHHFDGREFRRNCRAFSLPADQKIKEFSTGMKAKLKALLAMSYGARLLILDEPTAGLDVIARDEMLELMREYMEQEEGRAILISSHISSDLEGFCDDLYMIDQGQIVLHEDTDVILGSYGIIKADEEAYRKLERQHILRVRRESFGYACLTDEKSFYLENYPGLVVENGSVDEVIAMMIKGERV